MSVFRVRVLLDFLAIILVIACLAYWWLDNLSHELFGTALFVLVISHNVFNRRWYGGVTRAKLDAVRIINLVTIALLAIGMAVMLVTSFLVSRDLFPLTALSGAFAVREIHMFAGYWVLAIIAVHMGTRWHVVINVILRFVGLSGESLYCAIILRIIALAIVVAGARSTFEMGFGSKLMLSYSLDMWDFNESTFGFFLNYGAIVGMYAAVTYYSLMLIRKMGR